MLLGFIFAKSSNFIMGITSTTKRPPIHVILKNASQFCRHLISTATVFFMFIVKEVYQKRSPHAQFLSKSIRYWTEKLYITSCFSILYYLFCCFREQGTRFLFSRFEVHAFFRCFYKDRQNDNVSAESRLTFSGNESLFFSLFTLFLGNLYEWDISRSCEKSTVQTKQSAFMKKTYKIPN